MAEIETKVISVPMRLRTKKTNREFEKVITRMANEGWTLVHNSRLGAAGGTLTFQREKRAR